MDEAAEIGDVGVLILPSPSTSNAARQGMDFRRVRVRERAYRSLELFAAYVAANIALR